MSAPLLSLRGVRASYGGIPALFGIDLEVGAGEVVALLGPNGAGKTTTLRAISGAVRTSGAVVFDGRPIGGSAPDAVARLGLAHVPEGRGLFPSLTVAENLRLGSLAGPAGGRAEAVARTLELFPVLRERARQPAGTLSGGEQQMLAIARGLAARPRLLMVDELSLGLAPALVAQLFAIVPAIAAAGTAILLVEQFVAHALRAADRACVLDRGRVAWTGRAATLARRRSAVEASYLGRSGVAAVPGVANGGSPNGAGAGARGERVAVPVPAATLRALAREAAASGRRVEDLIAQRIASTAGGAS